MAKKYIKNENGIVRAVTSDNLQLEKPLLNENYDIEVHNRNMDKIDNAIQEVKGKIDGLELVASNVKMADGTTVQTTVTTNKSNISTLQSEVSANKTSIHLLQEELGTNKSTLKQILIDKKIEGLENENSLSGLINKVSSLTYNKTYLYKEGDQCIDLTGGWGTFKYENTTNSGGYSLNSDHIYLYSTKHNLSGKTLSINSKISIKPYSKLLVEMKYGESYNVSVNVSNSQTMSYPSLVSDSQISIYETDGIDEYKIYSLDISNLSGLKYIFIQTSGSYDYSRPASLYVKRIWLER